MALFRLLSIALLALLPPLVLAATPSVQEVSQLFRQGKQTQALEQIDVFLSSNPKDAQGRFLKGLILTELNRVPEAIKVFSDLSDDYPELPEPYNNLAVLYAGQGQYERAKNSLEMAIRTHPSYATAHENLGDIYAKMASLAYDKALQLDQANTSAQTKLALIKDLFEPPASAEPAKAKTAAKSAASKTAGVPPAAKAEPQPVKKAPTSRPATDDAKATVEQAVRAWAKAWSSQDVEAYLGTYAKDYAPEGMERSAWESLRRDRISKPAQIKVEVDELEIAQDGNKASASFLQHYQSDRYRDSGRKTLSLERQQDGAWKITAER
jgi:tetratricopeptide (TPR) repeat protein